MYLSPLTIPLHWRSHYEETMHSFLLAYQEMYINVLDAGMRCWQISEALLYSTSVNKNTIYFLHNVSTVSPINVKCRPRLLSSFSAVTVTCLLTVPLSQSQASVHTADQWEPRTGSYSAGRTVDSVTTQSSLFQHLLTKSMEDEEKWWLDYDCQINSETKCDRAERKLLCWEAKGVVS